MGYIVALHMRIISNHDNRLEQVTETSGGLLWKCNHADYDSALDALNMTTGKKTGVHACH